MTKSSFGDKGLSYKLDCSALDKPAKSLIGKQSVPIQVYYKLPRDNEWNLGYLLVQDHRVSFAKGFQDLSNDHMNWDTSFVIHGANVSLIDDAFAHIMIERKCYIDPLTIALRFNHPGDKQSPFRCDRYQFVSSGLEALFHVLNMASYKEMPIDETEVIENCGLSKFVFRSAKLKLSSSELTEVMKSSHVYVQIKAPPFTEYVRIALQDTEFPPNQGSSASPFPGGSFTWQPASNPQERVTYM